MNLYLYLMPIAGGLLIGLSTLIMMLSLGRVTGISGTFWEAVRNPSNNLWRIAFILGLMIGTALVHYGFGLAIPDARNAGLAKTITAGFLVGFGTKMGNGCTSGHGVCGIGRLSLRSTVATITFMLAGILTVSIIRHLLTPGAVS